jgi:hypothetical protein
MASVQHVQEYLAFWFQLGKGVVLPRQSITLLPEPIFCNGAYSPEFEACWQRLYLDAQEAYLEGTVETIAELLSPTWEISACARCAMPVPMISLGVTEPGCPCNDLPSWPNTELPKPRAAVDSRQQLATIRDRLLKPNLDLDDY